MENANDKELDLLQLSFYKTEFKKQDISKTNSFINWKNKKKKKGNILVRCPICWSYEISYVKFKHKCICCGEYYCQKCLKCLEYDSKHEHKPFYLYCCDEDHYKILCGDCCDVCKFLNQYNYLYYKDLKCYQVFLFILLYFFGIPVFLTIKYLLFFRHNKIRKNRPIHWLFTTINFITNIIYCCLFSIFYTEINCILFLPCLFYYKHLFFIVGHIAAFIKYDLSQTLFLSITVRKDSI